MTKIRKKVGSSSSSKVGDDDPTTRPSSSPSLLLKKKKTKRQRKPLISKVEGLEYETTLSTATTLQYPPPKPVSKRPSKRRKSLSTAEKIKQKFPLLPKKILIFVDQGNTLYIASIIDLIVLDLLHKQLLVKVGSTIKDKNIANANKFKLSKLPTSIEQIKIKWESTNGEEYVSRSIIKPIIDENESLSDSGSKEDGNRSRCKRKRKRKGSHSCIHSGIHSRGRRRGGTPSATATATSSDSDDDDSSVDSTSSSSASVIELNFLLRGSSGSYGRSSTSCQYTNSNASGCQPSTSQRVGVQIDSS
ncbi:hypothetical protein FRACYDRAFT_249108 [Fragilariopsis cylindrus CCMP1102]|uniref:Uncharacterized protein n=1 Tax=Fragilariopsis cylindrus CCMP1102 TaxID=635003 RepID=A0A1E7ET42_9STRA|nr:hypothetical protein FRACYDRAFT_249108 [Fragilariopsis cylindrus CCMP1102]|eukprot:OEU09188.1 hypothetical protein FRACYDRAFT_249108 [Fragilariopsis cylindrus CCMP1102]